MSKKYFRHFFRCPVHGEIDICELANPEHRPVVDLVCPTCGKRLEAIAQSWEVEPMSEKGRAFLWASAVTVLALAAWILVRAHLQAPMLPPFSLSVLSQWFRWMQ